MTTWLFDLGNTRLKCAPLQSGGVGEVRAIVADYVATHEPVGSKSLVERHQLGVSPATIRNDMAVLEAEGYISYVEAAANA